LIVVDSSAVVAIFRQEEDAARLAQRIGRDDQPLISAANVLETAIVLRGLKRIAEEAERWLDDFLKAGGIGVEPVTTAQTDLARLAHARFGKGGGHAAQLNFGDCFAYALAKSLDVRLLFKGADFSHTDLEAAL
jgi:ribonuclease VapC